MPEAPAAHVVHDGPGRLRLRLPALRGAADRLAALALAAAELPGVAAAQGAAMTGSLLILHRGASGDILQEAEARGLFILRAAAPAEPRSIPPAAILPAAGAAAAALLAAFQLLRREALPPALTLGYHAVALARQAWTTGAGASAAPPDAGIEDDA